MITIGIAEDQALFRKGIVGLLNSIPEFKVVIEAEHGLDLLDQYNELRRFNKAYPDITILDLNMPVMDGIKTTIKLKKIIPERKIIIISSHNDKDIIVHLYEKGANAFLDKNADPEEVEIAIHSILKTGFYFNEAAKTALEDSTGSENKIYLRKEDSLTQRETDILVLICQEKTAQEIADILKISKRTIDGHRHNLMAKTDSKNVTGLVLYAIRAGIINVSQLKINLY